MRLIAISGGIGSGKSVVSKILSSLGFPVYDCDREAHILMERDAEIIERIRLIEPSAVKDGKILRPVLALRVFSDSHALEQLNQAVHGAVRKDLAQWALSHGPAACFVETAILYQSEIDKMVSEVWEVQAPFRLRIDRVVTRNSLTSAQVLVRIESQDRFQPKSLHPLTKVIINDDKTPLLPQIQALLKADSLL